MGRISVNIGGGGGASSDEVTATAANVLKGKTYVGSDTNDESGTGTMPDQGAQTATLGAGESYSIPAGYHNGNGKVSAKTLEQITAAGTITSAEQILSGYKAYSDGVLYTGTMPDQGHVDATLSAGDTLKLPKGYYSDNGVVTVKPLSELTAAGTATAADIVTGLKAYVKGSLITGTMPKLSEDATIKYATGNNTPVIVADACFKNTNTDGVDRLCFRYAGNRGLLNANTLFAMSTADLNLLAQNIKKGVTVCGVTGTFEGYVASATDLYRLGVNSAGFKLNNTPYGSGYCNFESTFIDVYSATQAANSIDILSSVTYDFTGYTKLNIEFKAVSVSSSTSNRWITLHRGTDSADVAEVTIPQPTEGNTYTVSIALPDTNVKFAPMLEMVPRNDNWHIQRIWIS